MLRSLLGIVLGSALFICCAQHAQADWKQFRGPNSSGICDDEARMPVRWNSSANLKWKTKLPGPGVSSPIIVGDRIYVTCYSGYGIDRQSPGDQKNLKRHLVCIDRQTGKINWDRIVDAVLPEDPYEGIGVTAHGYASNTPVSDGENVYVFFGKTGALAFDKDGNQLWQTNLGKESDPRRWGSASSPILYNDLLIVPATAESEALVALDKKTGEEVWRQEATQLANTWSTPVLVRVDRNRTDLVMTVTQEIWGLNPETGKLRWFSEGAKARSFSSSPVSDGDVVYAIEGQSGVSIAVRAGGTGDVTKSHVLWTGRDSGRFGSPIVHHGRIYSFAKGVVGVIDAKSGKRVSRLRLEGGGAEGRGGDYASPILADGKFYMVRRSGDTFVVRAEGELEVLAVNRVTKESEDFSATPAASGGDLVIRSDKHLYCVAAMGQTVSENALASGNDPTQALGAEDAPGRQHAGQGEGRGGHQRRGNRGRGGRRGGGFDPAAMFKQRDANGDGKLSGDELSERMRARLSEMDSDKDGALTLEEFQKGIGRMFGGRGRGGRGGNPRAGKPDRPQRPTMEP